MKNLSLGPKKPLVNKKTCKKHTKQASFIFFIKCHFVTLFVVFVLLELVGSVFYFANLLSGVYGGGIYSNDQNNSSNYFDQKALVKTSLLSNSASNTTASSTSESKSPFAEQ